MRTSERLAKLEIETEEHCQSLDEHDQRVVALLEGAKSLSAQVESLNGFTRGGDLGPGLAGEVRELQTKVNLILQHLGLQYEPQHTVYVAPTLERQQPQPLEAVGDDGE